jgi:hypothetical protein
VRVVKAIAASTALSAEAHSTDIAEPKSRNVRARWNGALSLAAHRAQCKLEARLMRLVV